MKSKRFFVTTALILAMTGFVGFAGEGQCDGTTQECLDYMAEHMKARGWMGLELDYSEGMSNMRVKAVVPGSPAEAAGFKAGDRLVAMGGTALTEANKEALYAMKKEQAPGKQVTYTVERKGGKRELTVTLAAMPDEIIAREVGSHMLQHAKVDVAKN